MEDKITKIFNAADQIQAEMIHDHLKQNGIDCINGGGWNSLESKL